MRFQGVSKSRRNAVSKPGPKKVPVQNINFFFNLALIRILEDINIVLEHLFQFSLLHLVSPPFA